MKHIMTVVWESETKVEPVSVHVNDEYSCAVQNAVRQLVEDLIDEKVKMETVEVD